MPANRSVRSLDLLRVLAAAGVVLLHVATQVVLRAGGPAQPDWWAGNVYDSAVRWCVPVFVMISGALWLDPARAQPAGEFALNRARRIALPLVVWTLVYSWLSARQWGLGAERVLEELWHGNSYYHMWYVYMLPGLYALTPVLRSWLARNDRQRVERVVIAGLLLASGWVAFARYGLALRPNLITLCLPYVPYFVCGWLLRSRGAPRASAAALAALALACLAATALAAGGLVAWRGAAWIHLAYDPLSPTSIGAAVAIFALAQRIDAGATPALDRVFALAARLAPLTFGVYLIHPLVLHPLVAAWGPGFVRSAAVAVPLVTAATLCISALVVALVLRVPGLRRVVS